jgi:hypothetical protein
VHVVGERAEFQAMEVELGAEDVAGAAGVGQELMDRDRVRSLVSVVSARTLPEHFNERSVQW